MADNLGMTPATVSGQSQVLSANTQVLADIADEVARTGEASRWPGVFGLFPGNIVMTKGSIFLAENAASDVRMAAEAAAELLGRLQVNVQEQIDASSAGEGYREGAMTRRQADDLYNKAMDDPHALDDMTPEQVAAWWKTLSRQQQDTFVADNHWVAGNTNGIPFDRRVEANRLNAEELLLSGKPMSDDQRRYLEDVTTLVLKPNGELGYEKNLISLDPSADRIIEMVGELGPGTTNIVDYVPGTASDMNGFYDGSTQDLAHAIVDRAMPPGSTVAFVFKDAAFPGWGAEDGVYHSSSAARAGGPYHDFNTALSMENTHGASVTSIEHSYGSSVGGYAETQGTHFDNRIVLGGIGMTDDWKPDSSTDYYSYTGDVDIIRAARENGSDATNTGYEIPPTSEHGFTELDPGYTDYNPIDQHARVGHDGPLNQQVVDGIVDIVNR